MTITAKTLTAVFEKVFSELHDNLETNARNSDNNDAKSALYDVAYAVSMLDVPWLVKDTLNKIEEAKVEEYKVTNFPGPGDDEIPFPSR